MTVEARYVPVMHSLCRLSARGVSHVVIDANTIRYVPIPKTMTMRPKAG